MLYTVGSAGARVILFLWFVKGLRRRIGIQPQSGDLLIAIGSHTKRSPSGAICVLSIYIPIGCWVAPLELLDNV
jgi:hypothetical protein